MKKIVRALALTTVLVTTTMSATTFARSICGHRRKLAPLTSGQTTTLGYGSFLGTTGKILIYK